MAGNRNAIGDGSGNANEPRDPVKAAENEYMVNTAMLKAGVFKAGGYASEYQAAKAWWEAIKDLKLSAEVGVLISQSGKRFYLGSAYSDGAVHNVNGLIRNGYLAKGTTLTAIAHTHPNSPHLSGGGYGFSYGEYDVGTAFNWDISGDMRTAYTNQLSAFAFSKSGSDYFNLSVYQSMQSKSAGAVPLCYAATMGCR